jgi:hypothetical protein
MAAHFVHYRLVVQSHLSRSWPATLPVVDFITSYDAERRPVTSMTLRVIDQSELMGILVNLHGHGLLLTSLNQMGAPAN